MGSKKRSAWQKQKAQFAASLGEGDLFAELGLGDDSGRDPFARESAARAARDEAHEAALRRRACERKNRYASRYEAELTAAECAEHGGPPLHVDQCPYCLQARAVGGGLSDRPIFVLPCKFQGDIIDIT